MLQILHFLKQKSFSTIYFVDIFDILIICSAKGHFMHYSKTPTYILHIYLILIIHLKRNLYYFTDANIQCKSYELLIANRYYNP